MIRLLLDEEMIWEFKQNVYCSKLMVHSFVNQWHEVKQESPLCSLNNRLKAVYEGGRSQAEWVDVLSWCQKTRENISSSLTCLIEPWTGTWARRHQPVVTCFFFSSSPPSASSLDLAGVSSEIRKTWRNAVSPSTDGCFARSCGSW